MIGKAVEIYAPATIDRTTINEMNNAGVTIGAGGDLTITDSVLLQSSHDLIVMSGGSLSMTYSSIGGAQSSYEHCNYHIGSADSIVVTDSIIGSSVYGIMLGNIDGSVWTNNNFTENNPGNDVLDLGGVTNADMRQNYWDQGAPAPGAGYDTSTPLAAPNPSAGPR
jgi:hypothetical protein